MESKELYRVLVIGPTGAGKSQFCNFIQRDITNSKNEVSNKLKSCTKSPNSNIFTRNNTNYDFIDSAGSSDSDNDDIENLYLLIDFLKKKESIDYISLLLKFGERITNETKKYLETLGKIFTAIEFYTHLCVFFTKFPTKPKKKDIILKEETMKEINEIIKEIFQIEKNIQIPNVNVYFIDTELDEEDNTYDEKSQDTIDTMIKQMKLDVYKFNSINTKDFDATGENCKLRKENEKTLILKKLLEEAKLNIEKEEEIKKRLQEENQRMKERNEKTNKKVEELNEKLKKQEEESKKFEPIIERERKIQEEQRKIEEYAKKRNIEIERLDGRINDNLTTAGNMVVSGITTFGSSYSLGMFLFRVAGVSCQAWLGSAICTVLEGTCLAGLGFAGLGIFPFLLAGGYSLKKLST